MFVIIDSDAGARHLERGACLGVAMAVLMAGGTPLWAAEPPSVNLTVPKKGAKHVPTNAALWLFGNSLSFAMPELTLVRLDDKGGVADKLDVYFRVWKGWNAGSFARGAKIPDNAGRWATKLIVVRPRVYLAPNARHRLTYKVFPTGSRSQLTFSTGPGPDRQAPTIGALSNARNTTIKQRRGTREVTLVDLDRAADDGGGPVLVELLVGASEDPRHFALVAQGQAMTFATSRVATEPIRARVVDLAGNRSKPTAAIAAPRTSGAKKTTAEKRHATDWTLLAVGLGLGLVLLITLGLVVRSRRRRRA